MSLQPIREARRALDLAARSVTEYASMKGKARDLIGKGLLVSIHRFVDTVSGNLHLDRVRSECDGDYRETLAPLLTERTKLLRELGDIGEQALASFPVLNEFTRDSFPGGESWERFISSLATALEKSDELNEGSAGDANDGSLGP